VEIVKANIVSEPSAEFKLTPESHGKILMSVSAFKKLTIVQVGVAEDIREIELQRDGETRTVEMNKLWRLLGNG